VSDLHLVRWQVEKWNWAGFRWNAVPLVRFARNTSK
jgi:hypothetical protein